MTTINQQISYLEEKRKQFRNTIDSAKGLEKIAIPYLQSQLEILTDIEENLIALRNLQAGTNEMLADMEQVEIQDMIAPPNHEPDDADLEALVHDESLERYMNQQYKADAAFGQPSKVIASRHYEQRTIEGRILKLKSELSQELSKKKANRSQSQIEYLHKSINQLTTWLHQSKNSTLIESSN
jgi:hypothetical protein